MSNPGLPTNRMNAEEIAKGEQYRGAGERLLQAISDADAETVGQLTEGFRAHCAPGTSPAHPGLNAIGEWYVSAAVRAGVADIARYLMALDAVKFDNQPLIAALGIRKDSAGRYRLPHTLRNGEAQAHAAMRSIVEHAFNVLLLPDDSQRAAASIR